MLQLFVACASQPVNVSCDCAVHADFDIFMYILSCLPEKLKSLPVYLHSVLNNYCKMETNNKFQANMADYWR